MRAKNNYSIPDRTRPRSTTSASAVGNPSDGDAIHKGAKHTTGDRRAKEIRIAGQDFTVGTWNVRTLSAVGKLKELCHTMERYTWNILGLSEVRWPGSGEMTTEEGHKIWYIGEDHKREKGVAFLVHRTMVPAIIECKPLSSRLICIRIAAAPLNITVIQVYAPTGTHSDEEIEDFYQELNTLLKQIPKKDIKIVQGDWNAKVGTDAYTEWAGNVGRYGWGETNDRGRRLLEFARYNNLTLANTLYNHKASRRTTWHSPNGMDHNQLDYILLSERFTSGVKGSRTRSFPGADIGSDHELVMMTMKIKLKHSSKNRNTRVRYDLEKLKDEHILDIFQAQIGGRFAPLLLLNDPQDMGEVLGMKKFKKHPWVTDGTLLLCDKRRERKTRKQEGAEYADAYKEANKRVRKALREDKEQ